MKKNLFLGLFIFTSVLLLIVAFANIAGGGSFWFFFLTIKSTFVFAFLTGLLGFVSGFLLMMYAFEVKQLNSKKEEDDLNIHPDEEVHAPVEPAQSGDDTPDVSTTADDQPSKGVDAFDEDDEVLG